MKETLRKKAVLIVLDAVGAGHAPDAAAYGDEGANTLGHVISRCAPHLPHLCRLGLSHIPGISLSPTEPACGSFGLLEEKSSGKDTTTGHWELSGLKLEKPFPTYPNGFPEEVISAFEKAVGRGTLGNCTASGTQIIQDLGEEHLKTGKLIVYTSADSVFQIAAHEDLIPPEELWEICKKAREILKGEHGVGRVIARPFVGEKGNFTRTGNRRDFSLLPPSDTLLDVLCRAGLEVGGIGKIEDIFAHRGLTRSNHAAGNPACIQALLEMMAQDFSGLIFANLVDTDSVYGHRNDPEGFARCLEEFDQALPKIFSLLGEDDLLFITADHGCDPCFAGTDHTRERVPLLCYGRKAEAVDLGIRSSFADLSATILDYFHLPNPLDGSSFYQHITKEEHIHG